MAARNAGIAVVIPTKDAGPRFAQTLEAVRAQEVDVPVDLCVVDSGSGDDTVALARQFGARVLQVRPEEFGHGRTRNLGIASCAGEYVALLVQDAIPADRRWLTALQQALADHPRAAGAYSRHLPHEGASFVARQVAEYWYRRAGGPLEQALGDRDDFQRLPLEEKQVRCTFNNVSSMVRRGVWQGLPFPEVPFAEDLAWGYAALRAGHTVVYAPESVVRHSHERAPFYELCRAYVDRRTIGDLFGASARALTVAQAEGLLAAWERLTADDAAALAEAEGALQELASGDGPAWDLTPGYEALCTPALWRAVLGAGSPFPAAERSEWVRRAVARYEWAPLHRRMEQHPATASTLAALGGVRAAAASRRPAATARALAALAGAMRSSGAWADLAALAGVAARRAGRFAARLERTLQTQEDDLLTPSEHAALFRTLWEEVDAAPLRWAFTQGPAQAADPLGATLLAAQEATLGLVRQALAERVPLDAALYAEMRGHAASVAIGGRLGEAVRGGARGALADMLEARLHETV
ncbi:MAG: glycosyltransferase family 2 protein [Chloroflexi bacterium]|nr:glycosyltransferase family 2 protein [Chloroflexota bacterium]